jgi:uncharacterized protein (TIGR02453 family)
MPDMAVFSGFTKETVRFFEGLGRNNTREWFAAHKEAYDKNVMEPAKAFVIAMGERLRTAVPRIVAVPQVNKSIFRLNRDTRFSQDPTPYKTNLGLYFWEGTVKMESPGFYFHLEPPDVYIGGGVYMFSNSLLARYRRAAADSGLGRELGKIVTEITKREGYEIGGKHYKRVPAGYAADSPNAELLKHNGLHAGCEIKIPAEFFSDRLVNFCFERYEPLFPLHRWLMKLTR